MSLKTSFLFCLPGLIRNIICLSFFCPSRRLETAFLFCRPDPARWKYHLSSAGPGACRPLIRTSKFNFFFFSENNFRQFLLCFSRFNAKWILTLLFKVDIDFFMVWISKFPMLSSMLILLLTSLSGVWFILLLLAVKRKISYLY